MGAPGALSPRPRGQEQTARRLRTSLVGQVPRLGEVRRRLRRPPLPRSTPPGQYPSRAFRGQELAKPGEAAGPAATQRHGAAGRGRQPREIECPPAGGERQSRELGHFPYSKTRVTCS